MDSLFLTPTPSSRAGTLLPLQYMASRQSRWKVWLHLARRPTATGPMVLLSVTSLYPDAMDSFSIQMMQSWRKTKRHAHNSPLRPKRCLTGKGLICWGAGKKVNSTGVCSRSWEHR